MRGITAHQLEVLTLVRDIERNSGRLADFDQVLEQLSWKPSKESAQFTIRACVAKLFIQKSGFESRRGRNRVCYSLAKNGKLIFDPRPELPKAVLEPEIELTEKGIDLSVPGVDDDLEFFEN